MWRGVVACALVTAVARVGVGHGQQEQQEQGSRTATTAELVPLAEMADVADFDASKRVPRFYHYTSRRSKGDSDGDKHYSAQSSLTSGSDSSHYHDSSTSDVSSVETCERVRQQRAHRMCTPCPSEMLLRHTNHGLRWICGKYQRAHRTFKSDCMMRYRNCEDGTMFVKIRNSRCPNDTYNGRHWFYVYNV